MFVFKLYVMTIYYYNILQRRDENHPSRFNVEKPYNTNARSAGGVARSQNLSRFFKIRQAHRYHAIAFKQQSMRFTIDFSSSLRRKTVEITIIYYLVAWWSSVDDSSYSKVFWNQAPTGATSPRMGDPISGDKSSHIYTCSNQPYLAP